VWYVDADRLITKHGVFERNCNVFPALWDSERVPPWAAINYPLKGPMVILDPTSWVFVLIELDELGSFPQRT